MSVILVPLARAMEHCREYSTNEDAVEYKLEQASGIILKHMGYDEIPTGQYDETTSPPTLHPVYYDTEDSPSSLVVSDSVKASVLLQLSDLWEDREGKVSAGISKAVTALLSTSFDPPFA